MAHAMKKISVINHNADMITELWVIALEANKVVGIRQRYLIIVFLIVVYNIGNGLRTLAVKFGVIRGWYNANSVTHFAYQAKAVISIRATAIVFKRFPDQIRYLH